MNNICYWETGSTDPAWNLAFEEYLLLNRKDGNHLILWQNDNTVVVGSNQITEAEVNRSYVESNGVRVVRRATGGGAVFHDLGNLNYSFITDNAYCNQLSFEKFMQLIADALESFGISVEINGRNDLLIYGHKVSGTAQKIVGGRVLHHGTLLFDSDLTALSSALNVQADKFQGKGVKSVRSRVGNIRPYLSEDMTMESFWKKLKAQFSLQNNEPYLLNEQEKRFVLALKQEKYDSWEWTYGRSPKAQIQVSGRFTGGKIEIYADIMNGAVARIDFYGDFLSACSVKELSEALVGTRFSSEALRRALVCNNPEHYFGGITVDEILSLLF